MPNRRHKQPAIEQRPGREELAFLVPFFGILLLLPPLVDLFVGKRLLLFGLPLETLYLFGVWLLMIIGAMVLTWCRPFRDPPAGGDALPFEEVERQRAGRGTDSGTATGLGRFDGVD